MAGRIGSEELLAARKATEAICRPLALEDYVVQPEECVSPPKWHLAHTTWFFETFVLGRFRPGLRTRRPDYDFLFNSYYEAAGPRADKARRGGYSRPTVEAVYAYRREVDEALLEMLASPHTADREADALIELGIRHEGQHQELLAMDIKRIFHFNPSRPDAGELHAFHPLAAEGKARWIDVPGGMRDIGWNGDGFSFDNEKPRHRVFLRDFRIQDRLVSNGRYLEFIRDGGYSRPELWLSDGWRAVNENGWRAPLYWEEQDGRRCEFTLRGMVPLDGNSPVCHVSYYEADAFARWSGGRLPTEAEWETACALEGAKPGQMLGVLWQWTASAYLPYPGFRPLAGAVGEYNGKFMVDQMVLRGGSCATPSGHLRPTYRNFFPAASRWQFGGIRLAEDI